MSFLLLVACAPHSPAAVETPVVSGTNCKPLAGVPVWTAVSPDGATVGDSSLRVAVPESYTLDRSMSEPRRVALLGPAEPGGPATVVDLLLVPRCDVLSVPDVQKAMTARSLAPLLHGEAPVLKQGHTGMGDGIIVQSDAEIGGVSHPLWFDWVEVAGSHAYVLAVAASCTRTEEFRSVCDLDVLSLVRGIREAVE